MITTATNLKKYMCCKFMTKKRDYCNKIETFIIGKIKHTWNIQTWAELKKIIFKLFIHFGGCTNIMIVSSHNSGHITTKQDRESK